MRLTGCNLRCHFCDTEFEKGTEHTIDEIVALIKIALGLVETDLIVLTGGEPMRQQIIPAIHRFADEGWYTQIETAGTVWPERVTIQAPISATHQLRDLSLTLDDLIAADVVQLVCSPKTPRVHPKIEKHCDHFKYIIRKGEVDERDGLPNSSTQIPGAPALIYRPDYDNVLPTRWVQPCTEYGPTFSNLPGEEIFKRPVDAAATRLNMQECVRVALKHGHRVSLQTHRILEVD